MAYPVKYIHSQMQGAPVVQGSGFAEITGLLDAVLVSGFNTKAITTITRSGSTATAQIPAGHLYEVGQIVNISNAEQAEYNGDQKVLTVTATAFTFAVTGTPATPATTLTEISVKTAPLGFSTVYTGTNKRVYRTTSLLGSRPYIRVDGSQLSGYGATWSKFARVTIAEAMSGIDTFTGVKAPFDPLATTKNEARTGAAAPYTFGWYKWYVAHYGQGNAESQDMTSQIAPRNWAIIGDDRGFYFLINPIIGWSAALYSANELNSFKNGDAFCGFVLAEDAFANSDTGYYTSNQYAQGARMGPNYNGCSILRDYTQLGNPVRGSHRTLGVGETTPFESGGNSGVPFPNGPDFSLLLHPVYNKQENGHIRGIVPGMYAILNGSQSMYGNGSIVDNVAGYPGRKFVILDLSNGGAAFGGKLAFDLTGPWRT